MAIAAQLYRTDRAAERHPAGLDATLRNPASIPFDVIVDDLSTGGFRAVTNIDLALGAGIGLGIAGIGTRRARVVWRGEGIYGCEFLIPLNEDDLHLALRAPSSDPLALPSLHRVESPDSDQQQNERQGLSPRGRLLVIIAAATASWALLGGIVYGILAALL